MLVVDGQFVLYFSRESRELASRYTLVYLWVSLQILVVLLHHSHYKCWSNIMCVYHVRYRKRLLQSNKPFCVVSRISESSSFIYIKKFILKYFKIYHLWYTKIPPFCNMHCLCILLLQHVFVIPTLISDIMCFTCQWNLPVIKMQGTQILSLWRQVLLHIATGRVAKQCATVSSQTSPTSPQFI